MLNKQQIRLGLWILTIGLILWVSYQARLALIPFFIGTLFAYIVSPLVDRVSQILPAKTRRGDVWRRGISVLIVYAVALIGLIAAIWAVAPSVAQQTQLLVDDLPTILEGARQQLNLWSNNVRELLPATYRMRFDDYLAILISSFSDGASRTIEDYVLVASNAITKTIAIIIGFLVVPFWMFYAIRDRHFAETSIKQASPPEVRDDLINLARIGDSILGRYLRGQLLLGLVVGVAVGLAMKLLGVQWALWLGVWAGVTELIPVAGPWLGAIAGLIVVAATNPDLFIWVVVIYLTVQLTENVFLAPRIQGHAVRIHPGLILLLLVVAGSLWGAVGVIVIVPIAALLKELFWYLDRRLRGASAAGALDNSYYSRDKD
jgi:predicted PurR-regulated permease PerM|tara:strand:- start:536 stop:1660 length:1125 start_codon:yes stop_codon:yes gene_type:complete